MWRGQRWMPWAICFNFNPSPRRRRLKDPTPYAGDGWLNLQKDGPQEQRGPELMSVDRLNMTRCDDVLFIPLPFSLDPWVLYIALLCFSHSLKQLGSRKNVRRIETWETPFIIN